MNKQKQSGVTLIELSVVLLILVALAGLVSPYVGGTGQKAMCEATDVSMQNIKKVIMENYYVDTLGKYPASKNAADYDLTCLFETCGWQPFDAVTNVGFRKGGYLQNGFQLNTNQTGNFADATTPPPNPNTEHVNNNLVAGDTVILDAWGRPIILQIPTASDCNTYIATGQTDCARLVSAGSGNGIGIGNAAIDTSLSQTRQQDDRILYLNIPTPSGEQNTSCDQY